MSSFWGERSCGALYWGVPGQLHDLLLGCPVALSESSECLCFPWGKSFLHLFPSHNALLCANEALTASCWMTQWMTFFIHWVCHLIILPVSSCARDSCCYPQASSAHRPALGGKNPFCLFLFLSTFFLKAPLCKPENSPVKTMARIRPPIYVDCWRCGICFWGISKCAIHPSHWKSQQMESGKHAKARHYRIMGKALAWERDRPGHRSKVGHSLAV